MNPQKQAFKEFLELEELEATDRLLMFSRLTERCFNQCVNDFRFSLVYNRGLALNPKESECITNCTLKWATHSQVVAHEMLQRR